jgi:small subunit ribosomal protein S15
VKIKKSEVEELIVKLAKERYTSAVIGTILRDQYAIPDVKVLIGKTVSQVMRENNVYPSMPEDMLNLLKKAVNLRTHMEKWRQDYHSKKGLLNLESKIRRLGKYYSRNGMLPKKWKYDPNEAKLLVQKG